MSAERRELQLDAGVLALLMLANVALSFADVSGWIGLLAAGAFGFALVQFLGSLRRYDEARHGTFDLLVVCDHQPNGVRYPQLSRTHLWLILRGLDPDHHLVWINSQPLDADDPHWRRKR